MSFIQGRLTVEDGLWTNSQSCCQNELCLCQINIFPCGKVFQSRGCMCVCARMCSLKHACFHIWTYHIRIWGARACRRHSVNDDYHVGVCLSAEVEKGVGWDWMSAVSGAAENDVRARKREGARKRGTREEGWIVFLCGEREKRESLLWYVYMSMQFLVWWIEYVCLCLCVWLGFHIQIPSFPVL